MSNIFEQLRNEWSAFFRWSAGVSISLITITLTVLTFHRSMNGAIKTNTKVFAYITTGALLINVFLTWRLLKLNLSSLKKMADASVQGKMNADVSKEDTEAKCLEKGATVFFILSILSFIGYLITYIH